MFGGYYVKKKTWGKDHEYIGGEGGEEVLYMARISYIT